MTVQHWTQHEDMQNEFNRILFGTIMYSFLSWMISLGVPSSQQAQFRLRILVWLTLGVMLFIFFTLQKKSIQHAHKFHYFFYLQAIPMVGVLMEISISTIVVIGKFSEWLLFLFIALNAVAIFIGAFAQYQISREQLIASKDLRKGWWNLGAPLYMVHPQKHEREKQWARSLRRLSPLVTAFGFILARAIEGDIQSLIMAFCGYILGYFSIWGHTKQLAIALQLKEWEKEYEVDIKI
jgi:hypothetical protein